ncbi:MAG TPA: hypothetical protein VLY45_02015 [Nitrospiria bacterium]|nr:hypothetical protein [Nitrospiria bacterium]
MPWRLGRFTIIVVMSCLFALGATGLPAARAQTAAPPEPSPPIDYHPRDRTLTVNVNGMPLQQVIEELSRQTHIRFRPPAPDQTFDTRPVTASFQRMPIERAIKQLLGPSNTAMLYGTGRDAGSGTQPSLMEVRVLDLGIIPVAANSNESAGSPFPPRLSPEQLRSRRDEMLKRRQEHLPTLGGGGEGQRNINGSSRPNGPKTPAR